MSIKKIKLGLVLFLCFLTTNSLLAQISILSTNFNPLNVTAKSICQVNIMNSGPDATVVLEAKIINSAAQELIISRTMPFNLKNGLNTGLSLQFQLASGVYGTSNQASFVRTQHTLPSGNYKYCVTVTATSTEASDDYCEDIQSELNSFLYLVDPYDHDTIEQTHPLLIWNHSEPFNVLAQGEYFTLILVELKSGQTAENGIAVNNPLFQKNYVSSHQVQHPFDLKELEAGKRYGWQVKKYSNGTLVQQTEAWEFVIRKPIVLTPVKYVVAKKDPKGALYPLYDSKLYFQFDEPYVGGELVYTVYNSKREIVNLTVESNQKEKVTSGLKKQGDNRYELNLIDYNLPKGTYSVEIKTAKGEIKKVNFYVE